MKAYTALNMLFAGIIVGQLLDKYDAAFSMCLLSCNASYK